MLLSQQLICTIMSCLSLNLMKRNISNIKKCKINNNNWLKRLRNLRIKKKLKPKSRKKVRIKRKLMKITKRLKKNYPLIKTILNRIIQILMIIAIKLRLMKINRKLMMIKRMQFRMRAIMKPIMKMKCKWTMKIIHLTGYLLNQMKRDKILISIKF